MTIRFAGEEVMPTLDPVPGGFNRNGGIAAIGVGADALPKFLVGSGGGRPTRNDVIVADCPFPSVVSMTTFHISIVVVRQALTWRDVGVFHGSIASRYFSN